MMLYVMDLRPAPGDDWRGGEFQRMRSPIGNIHGDVMRNPSAAGRAFRRVCFWVVWYRMGVRRGATDGGIRLRRNAGRRVVWMMMMWRPSIASLSLKNMFSLVCLGNESFGLDTGYNGAVPVSRALAPNDANRRSSDGSCRSARRRGGPASPPGA